MVGVATFLGGIIVNIPYVFKRCSKCGEWKVASTVNFYKKKDGKYGLNSRCKKCRAEYKKQYRENNKDKIAEYKKQYYENNKEKLAEQHKQYYENNKDKILEYSKQYRENNKDKIAEYFATPQGQASRFNNSVKRRLREQSQGKGITKEQWLECMKFFGFRCAYSGQVLSNDTRSLDHIVPLNQGGEHEIFNLAPMYRPYNSSKQDKDLLEWYKEQNFYSEERLQKIYEWQEYAFNKWGYEILDIKEI